MEWRFREELVIGISLKGGRDKYSSKYSVKNIKYSKSTFTPNAVVHKNCSASFDIVKTNLFNEYWVVTEIKFWLRSLLYLACWMSFCRSLSLESEAVTV